MLKKFTESEIQEFSKNYRVMFVNSLGGFKSLVLIGSINKNGQTNLAPFSSFLHLGASPALFGLIFRPDSVERHTLTNIIESKQFTVNHVHESFFKKAHQTSARYPQEICEFDAVGLTKEFRNNCPSPFVAESNISIDAEMVRIIDIEENGTKMMISKINSVYVQQDCILEDGFIDLEKAGTLTCSGLDSYHTTNKLARLSYAKPNLELHEI